MKRLIVAAMLLSFPAFALTAADMRQKIADNAGCAVTEARWMARTRQWVAIYDSACTNEQRQLGEAAKIRFGGKSPPN